MKMNKLLGNAVVVAGIDVPSIAPGPSLWAQQVSPHDQVPPANQNSGPTGCVGCAVDVAAARSQAEGGVSQPPPQGGNLSLPGSPPATYAQQRVGPAQNLPNPLPYDLLLRDGHVIDAKNNIDRVTDVAIKDGKIAAVGDHLNAADAAKTIDVKGLVVTPGLVDIHTHYVRGRARRLSLAVR